MREEQQLFYAKSLVIDINCKKTQILALMCKMSKTLDSMAKKNNYLGYCCKIVPAKLSNES